MTPFVAVGCSLGGFRAVGTVLAGLTRDFPAPIAIVQHRSSHGTEEYCGAIARTSPLPVVEAEDKQVPHAGVVYVAPAGYHLLLDDDGFALSVDHSINYARPSIDVLFESVAEARGAAAVAVVLSGASRDGSAGALKICAAGGRVLVQDPHEAESGVLPRAALEMVREAAVVVQLAEIGPWLLENLR